MASKARTASGIAVATLALVLSALIAALEIGEYWSSTAHRFAATMNLHGIGLTAQLPIDLLLILTMVFYALAMWLPQGPLTLVQAIAKGFCGLLMAIGGIALIFAGMTAFVALVTLLLSFPFGTIAYFVQYRCDDAAPVMLIDGLAGHCFSAVQEFAAVTILLKILALGALAAGSLGFLKVRWLLITLAVAVLLGVILIGALWFLSGIPFLLYPTEAIVTAVLGLLVLLYGLFTIGYSLYAFALGAAGRVV